MAAYERVTLNRGGRNSRFDCTFLITKYLNLNWNIVKSYTFYR